MYFCKLIIKCIVYDRLRKNSRQNVNEAGGGVSIPVCFIVF